ncbi:MAG: nucleoside triphosphate pyrophosphohydrolase [bacterium]
MEEDKQGRTLAELIELMARLRSEGGCPWDREQTAESLTPYIIEEAYELVEAIQEGDPEHVCEECGDLMFQVVFQARLGDEAGLFDMRDVLAKINEKMTRRHPHVFGDASAEDAAEVRRNWSRIKKAEGKEVEGDLKKSVLGKVPKVLPALLRGRRLTENASEVGFDWSTAREVAVKVDEEWKELQESIDQGDKKAMEEEFGDMLFVLVNLSRFMEIDPELSLSRAIDKFIRRFRYIEEKVWEAGRELSAVSLDEMESYWEEAKSRGL